MAKISDDRTEEVNEEITRALERAFTVIGLEASGYASALAPHDTGRLRNSITYAVNGHSTAIKSYSADDKESKTYFYSGTVSNGTKDRGVTIGTNVEYAPYQEFGTSKMKASPFLRPAIENHLNEYENVIRTELGEVE